MRYLKQVLSYIFTFLFVTSLTAQEGYRFEFNLTGMQDSVAYLGYHLDGKTYVKDTLPVTGEQIVFEEQKPTTAGVYFLYTPNIFYEFLVSEQSFSFTGNVNDLLGSMEVSGSRENELFLQFQHQMANHQREMKKLQDSLKEPDVDSASVFDRMRQLNKINESFIDDTRILNNDTFYAQLMAQMARPRPIETPKEMEPREAELYRFYEYKSKFWEGIDFSNPGILRTPIFLSRTNEYLDKVLVSHPDSLIVGIDDLLNHPKIDSAVFQYLLVTIVNKYANSKVMGQDAIYVHLVDNYYANGRATWVDDATVTRMVQNSDRLKPVLIGKKAPNFYIPNLQGTRVSLNSFDQDYLILFIYDSGCGHCKKAAPVMAEAYNRLKEDISVELVAINISEEKEEWEKFVNDHDLNCVNLADLDGTANIGYYYYVTSTPQIFILNDKKEIIAKRLAAEQIEEFLSNYNRLQKS